MEIHFEAKIWVEEAARERLGELDRDGFTTDTDDSTRGNRTAEIQIGYQLIQKRRDLVA
jgi:hypothetical protein